MPATWEASSGQKADKPTTNRKTQGLNTEG